MSDQASSMNDPSHDPTAVPADPAGTVPEVPTHLSETRAFVPPDRSAGDGTAGCQFRGVPVPVPVRLTGQPFGRSAHAALHGRIRQSTLQQGWPKYQAFMDAMWGGIALPTAQTPPVKGNPTPKGANAAGGGDEDPCCSPFPLDCDDLKRAHGVHAYERLRQATECWLLASQWPTSPDELLDHEEARWGLLETPAPHDPLIRRLKDYISEFQANGTTTPYLNLIINNLRALLPAGAGKGLSSAYSGRWENPSMLELIWSYWHEEGMQCQAMNAIALRFQNRRSRAGRDPLAALDIDPLRPLGNLIWGWVESSYKRLTVERRAYEYDHHYGITLIGRAVPALRSADSRSKFLEAFHALLNLTHRFYLEAADTTRIPDGFPLLNALREVHLILSEGAHNQFGDLPWTSRVEMLIEQWLLARPEMREFLRGRAMVPYAEGWMNQVDTMKKLQGWTDVSVTHFHDLATCGEAVLLSVRHGPWATTNDQTDAIDWALYWRPEIQRYLHAYRAATGADLTLEPLDHTMPARLLQSRLARQQAGAAAAY